MNDNIQVIFWDFDGVLMNSNQIRDLGFEEVLEEFPRAQVDRLLDFHRKNGGLSRYVKFRHFFERIRDEEINDDELNEWAGKFSAIMMRLLTDSSLLIDETLNFVRREYGSYQMHIVSGSDQTELREICRHLQIDKYFATINGSPTPKTILVEQLIKSHGYSPDHCILIGDSINDFEAANDNDVLFCGYGNDEIKSFSNARISFSS